MEPFLAYGFLQRALLAGLSIAVACAVLGLFLILRRDAMIGHGLSHVAFAGVALGLFLNVLPLAAALAVSVIAAVGMMKLKNRAGLHGDTAIGILSSVGMAVGILLATLARGFNVELMAYLFGDILAIDTLEVFLTAGLAAAALILVSRNYAKLLFMTFDRESARVSGVRIARLDALLMMLTAVTVVLGMKVVGILLVAALIVIPAAAGLQVSGSFKAAVAVSTGTALLSVALGLLLALELDIPASAAIVILCALMFGLAAAGKKLRSRPPRKS